jgi:toxin ParE1/3/4
VKRVEFHEDARAEFLAAAVYYESQAPGLGQDFVSIVERTYVGLQKFPQIGRPFGRRLRRVIVPQFPFGLLYRIERSRIFVVAVMHLDRRPGYWRTRGR